MNAYTYLHHHIFLHPHLYQTHSLFPCHRPKGVECSALDSQTDLSYMVTQLEHQFLTELNKDIEIISF